MNTEIVVLEKPVHGGACLGRLKDGRAAFVRGGLPGERVRVSVTSSHKNYVWADVVEVLEPSEHRVEHVWPEAAKGNVGGVELGHVRPAYQRQWKSQVLDEQLRRFGGPSVVEQIEAAVGSSDALPVEADDALLVEVKATPGDLEDDRLLHRRTRVQLIADKKGRLGMRKFRSHDVVPLSTLPIADEALGALDVFNDSVWKGKWKVGERVSLEAPSLGKPVVVTSKGVFGPDGSRHRGASVWRVNADGKRHDFAVRPGGFWQTHREAPAVLVDAVVRGAAVEPDDVVLELYSGSGLFTRFLVDRVRAGSGKVLSLEGSADAVRSAGTVLDDAISSGHAEIYAGKVDAEGVADLSQQVETVDTVVLDPPRSGAGKAVVDAIANTGAKRVVLVSCDPAAGSRDVADFVKAGFRIIGIDAWDLFPHTHHFETVTVLVRDV